jgi:hypothetical protein
MKAIELFHMLGDVGVYNNQRLSEYKVVGPDGRSISGVHFNHEKKQVILRQRNIKVENRVDL